MDYKKLSQIERLDIARKKLGLTKIEFIKKLEISKPTYFFLLKNKKDISGKILQKCIEIYNISPYFILLGEEPIFLTKESKEKKIEEMGSFEVLDEIIELVRQGYYTPAGLKKFLEYLKSIKEITNSYNP